MRLFSGYYTVVFYVFREGETFNECTQNSQSPIETGKGRLQGNWRVGAPLGSYRSTMLARIEPDPAG